MLIRVNVTNGNIPQWKAINWQKINRIINNLRQRIYRASAVGDTKKVRSLQKLMLKSTSNILYAIRRVTEINRGKNTPGIDNIVVGTDQEKESLYRTLKEGGTQAKPVKRVYIPKKNGKTRPLGIPIIMDRCQQAIAKSALEPYWEAKFERTSYGFRPGRSAHDAIKKIHGIVRAGTTRHWVLDADIKGAFDNIDHDFLMQQIGGFPARDWVRNWLKAGALKGTNFEHTTAGTPQGGIISPLLANIALHGMEEALEMKYDKLDRINKCPFMLVRYADDFVIFAKSKNLA